jgi:hypothetical protein
MRCTGFCESFLGLVTAGGLMALSACGSANPCQGIKLARDGASNDDDSGGLSRS